MATATQELPDVAKGGGASENHNRFVRLGEFAIDTSRKTFLKNGRRLRLSPKCCDLLLFMVNKKGKLVTRDKLISLFWPDTTLAAPAQNLNSAMNQIRRASAGANLIETIKGAGYIFEGSVTYSDLVEEPIETPPPIVTPALARSPAVNGVFGRNWMSGVGLALLGVGSLLIGILLGTATYSLWWISRLRH
jgi:DNA-binding winged helix-turn-helix (wHTH) protein